MSLRVALGLSSVVCLVLACVPDDKPKKSASGPAASTAARAQAARQASSSPRSGEKRKAPARPATSLVAAKKEAAADPLLEEPFVDNFDRARLGEDWRATSNRYAIEDGQLCIQGARNHPIWLARKLPKNARIEFDATSGSADGDIKAEYWGNGYGAARGVTYDHASSYLTIFGGWKNRFHVLARIDEHAKDRPEIRIDPQSDDLRAHPVERDRTYHFKVERADGRTVRWLVDDIELLKLEDDEPLEGTGHDHFGFNNWEVPLCFDNLEITPLPPTG